MTRIDFYFNVSDKRQVAAGLVESALAKRRQVTICAADEGSAASISKVLWQYKSESFLPNVLANHAAAAHTPVVIHWQNQLMLQDELLINLTQAEPRFFSRFTQLIELVGDDEPDKITGRVRFKFYRDRGYEIKSIDYAKTNIE